MKNQELFDKTINILVKAYLNDTLDYGEPCGCAIGNLLAVACGTKVINYINQFNTVVLDWEKPYKYPNWGSVIIFGTGRIIDDYPKLLAKKLLKTGYSLIELAKIEKAFSEAAIKYDDLKTANFYGLIYICDVLMLIHEANETEIQQAKSLFVKELAV